MVFGMGSIRSMFVDVKLSDGVTKPMGRVNKTTDMATLKMGGFTKALEKNRAALLGVGAAFAGVGAGLTLALKSTITAGSDFQSAMANVSTMVDTTTTDMGLMEDQVLSLSKTFPISAIDTAGGLYQVLSAGAESGAEAMDLLTVATKTSVAGITDTTTSVSALTAVMKGYGLEFSNAEMVSDKLFKTVKLGQTTFDEMAKNVGGTVPLADALGVSLDELMAGYATLTGVTGNTVEVSTQLESIMTGLVKPTKDMEKTMKGLGFETSEEMIAELGLVGSLEALLATTDGSSKALGELFERKEGIVAILALMGPQFDTFNEKLAEMEDSAGAMGEAYEKNAATFEATRKKMSNSIFALKTQFGNQLMPTVASLGDAIGNVADLFSALPSPFKKIIAFGIALTAVLFTLAGAALLMAGSVSLALPALTALTPILAGVIATISPLLPFLIAIGVGIVLLHKAWKSNFLGIRNIATDAWKGISRIFKAFMPILDAFWTTIKDTFTPITQMLKEFGIIGEDTGKGFLDSFSPIIDFLKAHEGTLRTFGKILGWLATGPIRLVVFQLVLMSKALKAAFELFGRLKEIAGGVLGAIPSFDLALPDTTLPQPQELVAATTAGTSTTRTSIDQSTSIGEITVKTDDPKKFYDEVLKQGKRDMEGS